MAKNRVLGSWTYAITLGMSSKDWVSLCSLSAVRRHVADVALEGRE